MSSVDIAEAQLLTFFFFLLPLFSSKILSVLGLLGAVSNVVWGGEGKEAIREIVVQ